MKIRHLLKEKWKEFVAISLILVVSLIIRLYLIIKIADPMYYYDSYSYYFEALRFAKTGEPPLGISHSSFTLLLACWLYVFGPLTDSLFIARIFVLLMSLVVIVIVYLLAQKALLPTFAFVASLLVSLEPRFLSFSITTHNDIFVVLTGLSSLYLSLSKSKIAYVLLTPIIFMLSCLASDWIYVLIGPALLFIYASRISRSNLSKLKKYVLAIMIITAYTSVFFIPQVQGAYYSGTRFNPIEKVAIFLKLDLLDYVLGEIFSISENQLLNTFFRYFVYFGIISIIIEPLISRVYGFFSQKRDTPSQSRSEVGVPLVSIMIIFIISVFVLTVFTLPYRIEGNEAIAIKDMNLRYVTFPRVLALLICMYFCTRIIRATQVLHIPKVRLKASRTTKIVHASLLIVMLIFAYHLVEPGLNFARNSSDVLASFADASTWLKENLKEGELAIVPFSDVLNSLAPELYGRLIHYSTVWKGGGILLTANTSTEEILWVRRFLDHLLQSKEEIKYLVVDTLDPYGQLLFKDTTMDRLSLRVVKAIEFAQRSGYTNRIKIYQVYRHLNEILYYNLTQIDKDWFLLLEGDVEHVNEIGFHLTAEQKRACLWIDMPSVKTFGRPLAINLTVKPEDENSVLKIGFYFDVDGDGTWSGYEIDKTTFLEVSPIKDGGSEQYYSQSILPTGYPLVRIGLILLLSENSSIISRITIREFSLLEILP